MCGRWRCSNWKTPGCWTRALIDRTKLRKKAPPEAGLSLRRKRARRQKHACPIRSFLQCSDASCEPQFGTVKTSRVEGDRLQQDVIGFVDERGAFDIELNRGGVS